jgi:hypothetical protein
MLNARTASPRSKRSRSPEATDPPPATAVAGHPFAPTRRRRRSARKAASPATIMSPSGTRGRRFPRSHNPGASAAPIKTGQSASNSAAGVSAAATWPPAVGYSSQGTRTEASAIASQVRASRAGAATCAACELLRARRCRKCNMRSVVPAAETVASMPTTPFPSGAFTASFASAPPVKGSPPRLSAKTAAGSSASHRRRANSRRRRLRPETKRLSPGHDARHRRPHPTPPFVRGRKSHAQHGGDHAHLADAGVGEHRPRILLCDPIATP